MTWRLAARILERASRPGVTLTSLPDLWFFRADAPLDYERGYAALMNIAIAASGRKVVTCGAEVAANGPEQFLVLAGGRHYRARVEASAVEPYVALKLQFRPDLLAEAYLELADAGAARAAEGPVGPLFTGAMEAGLEGATARLLDCLDDPVALGTLAPLAFKELILRFLLSPAGAALRAGIGADHLRILRAVRTIEARMEERLTVEDLAKTAHMSPSHFAHRFREVMQLSPIQYLKQARLRRARRALLSGAPVGRLAEDLGYQSTSHFSRDFRRQFGLPPGAYARAMAGVPQDRAAIPQVPASA